MLLQVTHETSYHYRPAVETAQHMAYMEPCEHTTQQVLDHSLHVNPVPSQMRKLRDVFGNAHCFFSLQVPHSVLEVVAHSLIATQASPLVSSPLPWEKVRELFRYQAGNRFDAASEFVYPSPFVPRHMEFATFARSSFTPGASLLDACIDLTRRIHEGFSYESQSTQINTPALQALAQRKGVCQDFSHIMIACLRTLGLPARYVSGYVLTHPPAGQPRLVGSDASHAWVSVYLPDLPEGARWVDFDPTNNRWGWHAPGEDYVTVATGRDFGDVSPLRGVIHGGASHTLHVGVTVAPVGENAMPGMPAMALGQTQTQGLSGLQSQSQSLPGGLSQTQSQSNN
ncbi:transglutaminase [Rhodoferax lacus]|uniref:Transglutaminase n=1 Tax=Rhodoferax lacus TaxID=2184758 RepID=A0A3E1RG80_9BURK|nr:transglutaminase family protein [Rhodoferax lacus]RFO98385.1 transglutaminase [Rhodoferax lacus]